MIATRATRTIAAPAARGTRRRCSPPTIGIVTAATTVPATTGPTIVIVAPSSQISPATTRKNPARSHEERPRSSSHRGAAKAVSSWSSSCCWSNSRCSASLRGPAAGAAGLPLPIRFCQRTGESLSRAR